MKFFRRAVLLVCVIAVLSGVFSAYAADHSDLEQYASELSQYTGLKYYQPGNTKRYIDYKFVYPDCPWESVITYVNIGIDHEFYSNTVMIGNPASPDVLVNTYRQLPSSYVPSNLETISSSYCFQTLKLTREARLAFEKMCADAKALGYSLYATSAYRSYERQKSMYDSGQYGDLAARAGFSEHQTGLAVDVIHGLSSSNKDLTDSSVYKWYKTNAHKYGFIVRYPQGAEFVTGVPNEPWHLRYLGVTLATAVYNSWLTYDEYYMREIEVRSDDKAAIKTAVGVTGLTDIIVNGTAHTLSTYDIIGETYFKLRDAAVVFNGTPLQFDVFWDSDKKQIALFQGSPYSSDMALGVLETGQAVNVTFNESGLRLGENAVSIHAYFDGASNYYRLDDLIALFGYALPAVEGGDDWHGDADGDDWYVGETGVESPVVIDTERLVPILPESAGEANETA
jgi:D-alanyl-D-alanine carboxypeptidase